MIMIAVTIGDCKLMMKAVLLGLILVAVATKIERGIIRIDSGSSSYRD